MGNVGYGKSVANGMPLSVLAGKTKWMERLGLINYGMTFEGEAVSIAATEATISEILEKDVCGALAEKGRTLKRAYGDIARTHNVNTAIAGPDARPHLHFEDHGGILERELRWLMIQELARERVLSLGTLNLCYSHSREDLDKVIMGCDRAMRVVRKAVDQGSVKAFLDSRVYRNMHG